MNLLKTSNYLSTMPYNEDDYLLLSGIQHFAFCRRQWALIHIEQQWQDNLRTVEGNILHEKAHDPDRSEKRGGLIIARGMAVASKKLGFSGACDVVEFHRDAAGASLFGRPGTWRPVPVEYKRGKPKENNADGLQLCAQGMCLEEMLVCSVPVGFLFYGETKRREEVAFSDELRDQVHRMAEEMHELYGRRYTPKVKTGAFCRACSLKDLCLPKLCKNKTAAGWIEERLRETP